MKTRVMAILAVALLAVMVGTGFDCQAWLHSVYEHSFIMFGDSLTVGTEPYLRQIMPGRDIKVDAYPGVVISQADQWIKAELTHPPMAPTAVVAVGGNDPEPLDQFKWWVEGTIELFPASERIIWVNFCSLLPGSDHGEKNAVLSYVASLHRNVTVLIGRR